MPRATVATTNPDSIEIEYETFGSSDDPTLLLVAGFTSQLLAWDQVLCRMLADRGRHVIRFDNRDVGCSTHLDGASVNPMAVLRAKLDGAEIPPVPYTLSDMGNDAVGLLDALGIDTVHVMGMSMGGMIAQAIAIAHPERCRSLISVMSSTGDPRSGAPSPEARELLLTPPPNERAAYIDAAELSVVWSSKRYVDVDRLRTLAAANYDRMFYPQGAPRQLAAIYASGDRTDALAKVEVPTLVIHGRDDTLITPEGGTSTAEAVPGASLLLLADMGHDLPPPLWPVIVDAVISHTTYADQST